MLLLSYEKSAEEAKIVRYRQDNFHEDATECYTAMAWPKLIGKLATSSPRITTKAILPYIILYTKPLDLTAAHPHVLHNYN